MELRWTSRALKDLEIAGDYVSAQNPRAASRMASRIEEAVAVLETFPALGRTGRLAGSRELVVSGTPFLIIYRVRLDEIQLLRVLHHARKWA